MESLAAGRSISLPSLAGASAELATRVVAAYGTVREQFDTPIGRFEGIEEPLARIGGLTYVMNAARHPPPPPAFPPAHVGGNGSPPGHK